VVSACRKLAIVILLRYSAVEHTADRAEREARWLVHNGSDQANEQITGQVGLRLQAVKRERAPNNPSGHTMAR